MDVFIVVELYYDDWRIIACLGTEEEARKLINKLEEANPYVPRYYCESWKVGEIIEDLEL